MCTVRLQSAGKSSVLASTRCEGCHTDALTVTRVRLVSSRRQFFGDVKLASVGMRTSMALEGAETTVGRTGTKQTTVSLTHYVQEYRFHMRLWMKVLFSRR